jgi:conjugal transfer mating pair stabilization protein TraG
MDPFPLQTIGGLETLATLFNAIAAIFQGPMIKAFTVLATCIGAASAMIYTVWRNQLQPVASWFISYNVVVMVLLSPIARVNITDTLTGQFRLVSHVPFALAFTASTLSALSVGLTQTLEQVLQPLPPSGASAGSSAASSGSSSSSASSSFAPLSYSQTGFLFGAQVIAQMKGVQMVNSDMADNMKEFVNQCVVYDAMIGNNYTLEDLQKSEDIWGLVSEKPSKLRGFAWREVKRDAKGKFISSNGTQIISCAEGVKLFNALWAAATDHALKGVCHKIGEKFGVKMERGSEVLSASAATYLPGALNKLTCSAKAASEHIRQQMMIRSILKGNVQKTVELGGHPNFEATRAYLQQRQTYQTIGETVSQTLLSLKNVLEALAYALFIFVMLFALLPKGWQFFLFWAKVVTWIQLWPPLFAILNFLVTEYMASSLSSQMGPEPGLSIWNFVGISNLSADMAATAGYLSCLIPVIAWSIMDQGGYAFVTMASQLLGVSQGAASAAAAEKVTGNYSFGNVSMDGLQADNTSMFKKDFSSSYSGGHMSFQDGMTSRTFVADGEQILHHNTSQLPVTIHGSEAQEQVYRGLYNEAESFQRSESEQAMFSRQATTSDYLQIGKQASKLISSGQQWSNQETASSMQEAARHYSQAQRIAKQFDINEELVNQKLVEASGGVNISIKPIDLGPISVGVGIGANYSSQEYASARAIQAENQIKELAKSEDFRKSVQHGYQAFNSRNFDTNDQNVQEAVKNFSGHYEKANSHQQNAAKAYEQSQALQKEWGLSKSKSFAVDSNYTQEFVNHVGAERLEKLSVEEMQKEAKAFMAQKMASLEGDLRTKYDLKKAYATHQVPQVSGTPEGLRDQTFATINAQSQQQGIAVERQIDQDYQYQAIQSVDSFRFQAMRTGEVLENNYNVSREAFGYKVSRHAHGKMGVTQDLRDLYAQFKREEDNLKETPSYRAVNMEPIKKDKA